MKAVFFAETSLDIAAIADFVKKEKIVNYCIMPVSNSDPYFYDCFEHKKLHKWNNQIFTETRHYRWIMDYRENIATFKNVLPEYVQQKPYFNSLLFYLSYRYGNEYSVFILMLIDFFKKNDIEYFYTKNIPTLYFKYLEEITLFLNIRSGKYD